MTPTSEDIARHDPSEFRRLRLNERTVRRYAAGEIPVPEPTMMLLRLMAEITERSSLTTPPQAQP